MLPIISKNPRIKTGRSRTGPGPENPELRYKTRAKCGPEQFRSESGSDGPKVLDQNLGFLSQESADRHFIFLVRVPSIQKVAWSVDPCLDPN